MQITAEGACIDSFKAHIPGKTDVYTFVLISRFVDPHAARGECYLTATVVRACGHLCKEEFRATDPELDWYSRSSASLNIYCCSCHGAGPKFVSQCSICKRRPESREDSDANNS